MILERKIYDYIERNPNKRTSEIVFQMNTDYTDFDIVLDALRRLVKEGRVFGEVGHTVRGTGAFVTWTKV